MALLKSVELTNGTVGEYWKIVGLNLEILLDRTSVFLALYKDRAARQTGKEPMSTRGFIWVGVENPATSAAMQAASPLTLVYDKIKTHPDFNGATDV